MAGRRTGGQTITITIALTDDQRRQVKEEAGHEAGELKIEVDLGRPNPWVSVEAGGGDDHAKRAPQPHAEEEAMNRTALRIELTAEQREQLHRATGKEVATLELVPEVFDGRPATRGREPKMGPSSG